MKLLAFLLAALLWMPLQANADPCNSRTGSNATVIFPDSVHTMTDGTPIADGSQLSAHTDDGTCVGVMEWRDGAQALTVWGNDVMTAQQDGFRDREEMTFVLYTPDASEDLVVEFEFVDRGSPFLTEPVYRTNGMYQVASITSTDVAPADIQSFDRTSVSYQHTSGESGMTGASPNPFNPQTSFDLMLQESQHVHIAMYDVLGREVATVHDAHVNAGRSHFDVEARDLPSGTYFLVAQGRDFRDSQRVTLVR